MADYRIGDLPTASAPLNGTEEVEVIKAGSSRKLRLEALWDWIAVRVQLLINTAISGSIDAGDPAGGDLASTYPNPTLKPLVPSPAGSYLARDYTMVVDTKGRVLSMASTPAPVSDAVLYTPETRTAGEQLIARGNINAQVAEENLGALIGADWTVLGVDQMWVWTADGFGTFIIATTFGQSLLALPNASALAALSTSDGTVRISSADPQPYVYDPSTGTRHIMVDLSTGSVVINLPPIEVPGVPPPGAMPLNATLDIKIHGVAAGNTVTVNSATSNATGIDDAVVYVLSADYESVTLLPWKYGPGPTYVWSVK